METVRMGFGINLLGIPAIAEKLALRSSQMPGGRCARTGNDPIDPSAVQRSSFIKNVFVFLGLSFSQKKLLGKLEREYQQISHELRALQEQKKTELLPCISKENVQAKQERLKSIDFERVAIRSSAFRKGVIGTVALGILAAVSTYWYTQFEEKFFEPQHTFPRESKNMQDLTEKILHRKDSGFQGINEPLSRRDLGSQETQGYKEGASLEEKSLVAGPRDILVLAEHIQAGCASLWAKTGYHPAYDELCYKETLLPLLQKKKRASHKEMVASCFKLYEKFQQALSLLGEGSQDWQKLSLATDILGYACPRTKEAISHHPVTREKDLLWEKEQRAAESRIFGNIPIRQKDWLVRDWHCPSWILPEATVADDWNWKSQYGLQQTWGRWILDAYAKICPETENCDRDPMRIYTCIFRPLISRLPGGERDQGMTRGCSFLSRELSYELEKNTRLSDLFDTYCPTRLTKETSWIAEDPSHRDIALYQRLVLSRWDKGLSSPRESSQIEDRSSVFDPLQELRGDLPSGSYFYFDEGMKSFSSGISDETIRKELMSQVQAQGKNMGESKEFLRLCQFIAAVFRLPKPLNNKEAQGLISTFYSYIVVHEGKEKIAKKYPSGWNAIELLYTQAVPQFTQPLGSHLLASSSEGDRYLEG